MHFKDLNNKNLSILFILYFLDAHLGNKVKNHHNQIPQFNNNNRMKSKVHIKNQFLNKVPHLKYIKIG